MYYYCASDLALLLSTSIVELYEYRALLYSKQPICANGGRTLALAGTVPLCSQIIGSSEYSTINRKLSFRGLGFLLDGTIILVGTTLLLLYCRE